MRRRGRATTGRNNEAILGEHNVISDISGFKFKASEMRRGEGLEEGLVMHWSEWSPENPQLHIHVKPEDMTVKDPRTRTADVFEPGVVGDYLLQNGDNLVFNEAIAFEASFN